MSEDAEVTRIVYDAEWEPGEIAGIDGTGLQVGQKVLLVQPEEVTEGPLEWAGVVEEVDERYGRVRAGVRMALRADGSLYDPELARDIIRFGVFAADLEALKPRPASRVRNPDGSTQGETAAEFTRRIVGTAITHLLGNGLLTIPEDARERMDEGIPLSV